MLNEWTINQIKTNNITNYVIIILLTIIAIELGFIIIKKNNKKK